MSGPFIYIGIYPLKPGKLAEARERCRQIAEYVEKRETQLLAFHFFLDEANERLGVVQVHPDANSMQTHMALVAEHLATAWDWLQAPLVQQAFGSPPAVLTRFADEYDEPLDVFAAHAGGFTRTGATDPGLVTLKDLVQG